MFKLYISIANEKTEEWELFKVIPLKIRTEIQGENLPDNRLYVLNKEKLELPNKELLELIVGISSINLGMSFIVISEQKTLLNIGCFKQNNEGYDPSIILLTPKGLSVSFMLGQ